MKLHEIEFSPEQLKSLERLLDKVNASAAISRDSSDILRRTFPFETKAGSLNLETRSVRVVASTAAIDGYDEIVEQDWRLERYRKNPVVLYNHNAVGLCGPAEDTLPIGYGTDVAVTGEGLEATLHFVDSKANELAERVWQGFKQGSIRAVSVGFRAHSIREELRNDKEIVILSDNELFEISACPVPANPEAVARSIQRNRDQAKRLARSKAQVPEQLAPRADAAQEPPMTEQAKSDLEKRLAEAEAENAKLKSTLAERESAIGEQVTTIGRLTNELAEMTKSRDELEADLVERDVTAIIGKKITPAQKEDFIEDRKRLGSKKFAERVARMPDLKIMERALKDPEGGPIEPNTAAEGTTGEPIAIKQRLQAVK